MSAIFDSVTINGKVPKMLETYNNFIINGQVYDKDSLNPISFNNVYTNSSYNDIIMNISAKISYNNHPCYYNKNAVIIDKYNSDYSFVISTERSGEIRIVKFMSKNSKLSLVSEYSTSNTFSYFEIYSQDVNFIYGTYTNASYTSYIFKINKTTLALSAATIDSSYNHLTLLKDTPLYIYYAYSTGADNYYIGRYNKNNNSKTDIFNDNGTTTSGFNSVFTTIPLTDSEFITLRTNKSFNNLSTDKLILKKYTIDYDYEKVYSKNLELDCSLMPDKYIPPVNSVSYFTNCHYFNVKNKEYFVFWNKYNNYLYLASKTGADVYTIIQIYEFSVKYFGMIPYNNNQTFILYNDNSVDFISFREFEEKFEMCSSLKGTFMSLGIDKNERIWVQNLDNSVETLALNTPIMAESTFTDTELSYKNEDIETTIEVFCKNFNGDLIESNIEVMLTGPAKFKQNSEKKILVKTSTTNTITIPIVIVNSGIVETNVKII